MNFKENISIAIYSIRTHLMRSLLTMLGVIIGVFSVIAIITIGNGGRDYIVGMVRDMGQNLVNITVDITKVDASQYITREDIIKIRELDNVQYVSPRNLVIGSADTAAKNSLAIMFSGTPDLRYTSSVDVLNGRFFNEDDYRSAARVCLIAKLSAEGLFGRTNVVGEFIDFSANGQTMRLRIIGVCDISLMGGESGGLSDIVAGAGIGDAGEFTILAAPMTMTDMMSSGNGGYDAIQIVATDDKELDAVGNAAVNILYTRHGNRDAGKIYTYTKMATFIDLLDTVINILTTFIAGVSAISLLVGGIGVMNIMLVSVTERTREIGIRKALGARTSTIMFQFLTESVILCMIGGFIGMMLGVVSAQTVGFLMKVPIQVKFSTLAVAIGFSTAIGVFFGIYPARRAAKMLPIDALRRD